MYKTNRNHKNNMLLSVCVLFSIQILQVCSVKTTVYSHEKAPDENFDITTIYRITNPTLYQRPWMLFLDAADFKYPGFLSTFNGSYSVEIHSRTNAIGIPIQTNNYTSVQTNVKELFNAESLGTFQNNSRLNISYNSNHWKKRNFRLNEYEVYNSLEFKYSTNYKIDYITYYDVTLFSLQWAPIVDHRCLSITYIHRETSYLDVSMNIFDEDDNLMSSLVLKKDAYNVNTVKVTDTVFMKDHKYKLRIQVSPNFLSHDPTWFGLYQIIECSNNDEDLRIVSINDFTGLRNPKEFHILGDDSQTNSSLKKSCLNGGHFIQKSNEKCACPPGFTGKLCETACGMNSFGADCKGICSINAKRMCRGMLMCNTNYGCTCPVGLTGPLCKEDCGPGRYGADCGQTCSKNCRNNACDRYTGLCLNGCSSGYISPSCLERYPNLISPPIPISIDYESIQIELNFESNNIRGRSDNIILKYYQLVYKSSNEYDFINSEIRLINQNISRIQETLNDLQPGTKYSVGVLLITDDVNYNENDIVYGEIETLCDDPQYIDYNVTLVAGLKSINVTWNKVYPSPLECNIDEYVLTLMHNQMYDVQEIYLVGSDSGHFIDDLLPGFQYDIKLTPKTKKGPLVSSPTYSITTLMKRNDFKIKEITAENEDGKIKVHWNLLNAHQNSDTPSDPITCVIRFKIKRILSCSKEELENDWTSIKVSDHTNYEITDVVPNSQYGIQVLIDGEDTNDTIQRENTVYVVTPASSPKTEPILDPERPIYVTNNSVSVQWTVVPEDCSKLNGFFSNFYVDLRNTTDDTVEVKETKQRYISFYGLKSYTAYELKVFIKTHVGMNIEHFLLIGFTTKRDDLKPVDDLMVYKKSLKNRMAGFRWSYANNTPMDGFIVSYNGNAFTDAQNVSVIPPTKCPAWPEYYCHTFYNMIPSYNYTFKVMPRSPDHPEGAKVSSISFNSIDGLPDSPTNVITTAINSTNVTVRWDIPWIFNGALKMFNINVEEISALDMNTCCDSIAPIEIPIDEELPTYNFTLTGLKPGSTYSVGVLTVSKSLWYGPPTRISVTTLQEE